MKRSTKQTSMAAVFAVASELSRRGYSVKVGKPGLGGDVVCSSGGKPFRIQVNGYTAKEKGFPPYIPVGKDFLEASLQQDLFLVVVGVPAPAAPAGMRFFVLSHGDALREWNSLSDETKDGAPYDQGPFYWGLYLKKNIEPYEGQWDKLPESTENNNELAASV